MAKRHLLLTSVLALAAASASVAKINTTVTINTAPEAATLPEAQKYVVIYLDDKTYAALPDGQKVDWRETPDEVESVWAKKDIQLQVWTADYRNNDPTFKAAETPDANAFGVQGGYKSWTVTDLQWSGLGFNAVNKAIDMSVVDDTYILHIGVRASDNNSLTFSVVTDGARKDAEAPILLGLVDTSDKKKDGNFTRNGEWQSVEIPVSDLIDEYDLDFEGSTERKGNYFTLVGPSKEGAKVEYDAIYFYKPGKYEGETGIQTVGSEVAAAGQAQWFTVGGQQVSEAQAQGGVFIKKQGGKTIKVMR